MSAPTLTVTLSGEPTPAVLAALRALADALSTPPDAPALAPEPGLLLVPRGAKVQWTMDRSLPLGQDGILSFVDSNYDGPIVVKSVDGAGQVSGEDTSGKRWRFIHNPDAAEGDTITATFEADVRHGPDVVLSDDTVTVTLLPRDAQPLQEADFAVVPTGQPAPAA